MDGADLNYWHSHHANKHNIRNYRYRMSANNTGVLGIEYEEVSKVVKDSDNDWMKFIKDDSDGLTKTGQILLQSAIESYVYSVLRRISIQCKMSRDRFLASAFF